MVQYRVKWDGSDEVDNVWYPAENFENAKERVRRFHQRNPRKPGPKNKNRKRTGK